MRLSRSMSPAQGAHRGYVPLRRTNLRVLSAENGRTSPTPVLHCAPFRVSGAKFLQFHSFDEAYLQRLRDGDFRTQEHFCRYFTALIQLKLRSRLQSREAIEDIRQDTFLRFYAALLAGKILHAERLGSYVNSICDNRLKEQYRANARDGSVNDDEDERKELPGEAIDPVEVLSSQETEKKVRETLEKLSERDRRLLREVFLEERDKDEVCLEWGIDRDYLRVLLHRAKKTFKSLFTSSFGEDSQELKSVC
jgi:RNA polymerase sigma-70 factor, ECF subfamily